MIDKNYLQIIAIKNQTTFDNIAREYLQQLFLSVFYQLSGSEKFLFKGGTALRLVFRSPRFSEDLDFSATGELSVFETLLIDTLAKLQNNGIEWTLATAERTTGGYFAKIVANLYDQKYPIVFNVSYRRKKTDKGERNTVASDYFPTFPVTILEKKSLVTEKIEALLTRSKPRDFFDLYFILRSNLLSSTEKVILKKTVPILSKTKIDFSRELKVFLPKSHWPIIKDFKKIILNEVEIELGKRSLN